MRKKRSKLDVFDMMNFYKFFKNLYTQQTMSREKLDNFKISISRDRSQNDDEELGNLKEMLDKPITYNELIELVNSSKKGRAVAEDLISLRHLGQKCSKQYFTYLMNPCV